MAARRRRFARLGPVPALLLALGLSACASLPSPPPGKAARHARVADPLQPLNRRTFALNRAVDRVAVRPIAKAYGGAAPAVLRHGVSNLLANLREPSSAANDILQGRPCQAAGAVSRFVVNSTIGLAGLVDVAQARFGLDHHDNDLGLTLAAWKVPPGPYLVLPLLGPSNVRDTGAFAAEWFLDPVDIAFSQAGVGTLSYVRTGLEVVDGRAAVLSDTDHLDATALDPYATYRSAARQSRLDDARAPRCQLWHEAAPAGAQRRVAPAAGGTPRPRR